MAKISKTLTSVHILTMVFFVSPSHPADIGWIPYNTNLLYFMTCTQFVLITRNCPVAYYTQYTKDTREWLHVEIMVSK